MSEMETVSDIARAESTAMALEQDAFRDTAPNVLEGDSLAPAAVNMETDPIALPHVPSSPQSDQMQVDDEF